jgi:hypothetical protein
MALSAEEQAHRVHDAIKGLGTDDEALIQAITSNTNVQLQAIQAAYQAQHSHDMIKDIKGDTSGDYKELLVGLCLPHYNYCAEQLHKAVEGAGTDEGAIIDILAHASNAEIKIISEIYVGNHKHSLIQDIDDDTSGHFRKALEHVLELRRNEALPYDPLRVDHDAHEIHHKGEGKIGTDDDYFVNFFTTNPFPHIFAVDQAYTAVYGHGLVKACQKELSGNYAKFLIAMVTPKPVYWAERIHHAVAGAGTKDELLRRAFIFNSPQELHKIGEIYQATHNKSLRSAVEDDTSFNYKKTFQGILTLAGL